MKWRVIIIGMALTACLVVLVVAFNQRQQLEALRTDQQRLVDEAAAASNALATASALVEPPAGTRTETPLELLELRSEVTRLLQQRRELAGVSNENQRLHSQLAAKRGNSGAAPALSPDYMLKSKAQWKGFATQEDTLQSFLWAARNHDLTNLLQTLTPEAAQHIWERAQNPGGSMDEFYRDLDVVPGMRILERTQTSDNTVEMKIEFLPGIEAGEMRMQRINGQWKLEF